MKLPNLKPGGNWKWLQVAASTSATLLSHAPKEERATPFASLGWKADGRHEEGGMKRRRVEALMLQLDDSDPHTTDPTLITTKTAAIKTITGMRSVPRSIARPHDLSGCWLARQCQHSRGRRGHQQITHPISTRGVQRMGQAHTQPTRAERVDPLKLLNDVLRCC